MSEKEDEEKPEEWKEEESSTEGEQDTKLLPTMLDTRDETSSRTLDTLSLSYVSPNIFDTFPGNMAPKVSVSSQTDTSWLKHYHRSMGEDLSRHLSSEKCISSSCSSEKEIYSALTQGFSDISILSDTEFTAAYLVLLEESLRTLPSVGPPTILAYKPESSEKGMFPELQMLQDHFAYVVCEFCGRELKPFPTYEQYNMHNPEKFFCCKQYQNLYEFLANEEKNLMNEDKIEPISIEPHKPYISEFEGQEKLLHTKEKNLWHKDKIEALTTDPYKSYQGDLERQRRSAKESQNLHEVSQIKRKKLQQKQPLSVTSQKFHQSELERQRAKEKYGLSDFPDDDKDHMQRRDKTQTLKTTPHKSYDTKLKRQRAKDGQDFSDFSDDEDHFQEEDETSFAQRQRAEKEQDLSDFFDKEKDHLQRKAKTSAVSGAHRKSRSERERVEEGQDLSDFFDKEKDHLQRKAKTSAVSDAHRKSRSERERVEEGQDLSDFFDKEKDHLQRKAKTSAVSGAHRKSHSERERVEEGQDLSDFSSDEDEHLRRKDKTRTFSVASQKSRRLQRQTAKGKRDKTKTPSVASHISSGSELESRSAKEKQDLSDLSSELKRQVKEKQNLSDVPHDKQKKMRHKDKAEAVYSDDLDSSLTKERQKLAKSLPDKQKDLQQDDKTEAAPHKPHRGDLDKQGLQSKETQNLYELPHGEEKGLQHEDTFSDVLDKSYSREFVRQQTKEKFVQRLHRGSDVSFASDVTDSQHLKTISFNLSDPSKDKWTFPAVQQEEIYADTSNYNIISGDFTVACEKMMPREFLEKYYKDGGKFLTLFPDGTAQLFYPSGNLAIIIIGNDEKNYCCIVYADKSNNADIQAIFESKGRGTCYHPNGNIWINMNAAGGDYADDTGNRVKSWKWKNNLNSNNPPSFKPIFISLNHYIGIRILGQDKIIVSFLAMGRQARFSVGAKVQVTATEPLPLKQVSKEELLLFASKIKIQILFNKLHEFLNFPSNIQWTKMKPPLYLVSQTQKLIYLCRLSNLGRDVDALVKAVIDEHS
ncbi:glutamate-rich protein 6 isoform X2 [Microcaecilia unicolor]|uniref:Glutamate-rich protein 6 isoform X2 n=1 Tax=Microcaecilia unicolor TaxID=1415580 RepID=A0A6P7ZAH8_9AMPH|nr:glutamate-rich protein 6 isoform X2 [Microcaecilia unicolor]